MSDNSCDDDYLPLQPRETRAVTYVATLVSALEEAKPFVEQAECQCRVFQAYGIADKCRRCAALASIEKALKP